MDPATGNRRELFHFAGGVTTQIGSVSGSGSPLVSGFARAKRRQHVVRDERRRDPLRADVGFAAGDRCADIAVGVVDRRIQRRRGVCRRRQRPVSRGRRCQGERSVAGDGIARARAGARDRAGSSRTFLARRVRRGTHHLRSGRRQRAIAASRNRHARFAARRLRDASADRQLRPVVGRRRSGRRFHHRSGWRAVPLRDGCVADAQPDDQRRALDPRYRRRRAVARHRWRRAQALRRGARRVRIFRRRIQDRADHRRRSELARAVAGEGRRRQVVGREQSRRVSVRSGHAPRDGIAGRSERRERFAERLCAAGAGRLRRQHLVRSVRRTVALDRAEQIAGALGIVSSRSGQSRQPRQRHRRFADRRRRRPHLDRHRERLERVRRQAAHDAHVPQRSGQSAIARRQSDPHRLPERRRRVVDRHAERSGSPRCAGRGQSALRALHDGAGSAGRHRFRHPRRCASQHLDQHQQRHRHLQPRDERVHVVLRARRIAGIWNSTRDRLIGAPTANSRSADFMV